MVYENNGSTETVSIPDADGMITWYRVHAQTFLSPDEEIRNRSGQNPKVYVYAVVPYRVHSSTFSNASQPSVGIEQRKASAAKTYDYIYTGHNHDIIAFEIVTQISGGSMAIICFHFVSLICYNRSNVMFSTLHVS